MAFSGSEWKTVQVLYRETSIGLSGIHTGFCHRGEGEGEVWALASSAISNTSFVVICICFHQNQRQTDTHTAVTHQTHTHNTLWHNIEHTCTYYTFSHLNEPAQCHFLTRTIHTCEWYYRQKFMSKLFLGGGGKSHCMNRVLNNRSKITINFLHRTLNIITLEWV